MLVSTRELRVIFPRDTATAWGWSGRSGADYPARYTWRVLIDGMHGPRRLVFSAGRADDRPGERMSLDSLLSRGGSLLCGSNAVSFDCADGYTTASTVDGQVVLSMADTATIRRLFALRPRIVHASYDRPGEPDRPAGDSVVVEYVAPQIPVPNAAVLAEAAGLRREAATSTRWTYRMISGGLRAFSSLWVAAGDSVDLGIAEFQCAGDVCGVTEFEKASSWTVDDKAIVALRVAPGDSLRLSRDTTSRLAGVRLFTSSRAVAGVVTARHPGRTILRVTLPVPAYEGPPRPHWSTAPSLEREIIVPPPTGRVELAPPRDTLRVGEQAEFSTLAFDRAGTMIPGAPIELQRVEQPTRTIADEAGRAGLTFDSAGTYTLIARFGGKADTLTVMVANRRVP